MSHHPVTFRLPYPGKFERAHVLIRLLVAIALGLAGISMGWSWGLLYLLLPAFAAAAIVQRGGERYLAETAPRLAVALRWLLAIWAYLALLTDAVPDKEGVARLDFELRPTGKPTVGSALLRLLTSIPAMIVLFVFGIVSAVIWLLAMIWVAIAATYPEPLFRLQVAIYRFQARLLAYHASLCEEYPPVSLEDETMHILPDQRRTA